MTEATDLFEALHEAVGCTYMSDLHREPYRLMAVEQLTAMNLKSYSMRALLDMAEYLFQESPEIEDAASAEEYFRTKLKEMHTIDKG